MSHERELRTLLDRRELYDLALRYARAVDRRDYPAFRQLLTDKGRIALHHGDAFRTEPVFSMEGHETIVESMSGLERYERTNHVVANQLVEIDGDRATGETYCIGHHIHRENGVPMNLTAAIRYQDRFVRVEGRWYFEERRVCVDWERNTPLGENGWVAEV